LKGIIDKIIANIILDFENDRQIRTKSSSKMTIKRSGGSNTLSIRGMLHSYRACDFKFGPFFHHIFFESKRCCKFVTCGSEIDSRGGKT